MIRDLLKSEVGAALNPKLPTKHQELQEYIKADKNLRTLIPAAITNTITNMLEKDSYPYIRNKVPYYYERQASIQNIVKPWQMTYQLGRYNEQIICILHLSAFYGT